MPRVLDACLRDPEIGGAILAGHFGGYVKIATPELGQREERAAGEVVEVARRYGKPVILHTIYAGEPLPALEKLRAGGLPTYCSLEASANAMAALRPPPGGARSQKRRSAPDAAEVERIVARESMAAQRLLLEPDSRALLRAYGLPVPPYLLAATPQDSAAAARDLGARVAMKLVASGLVHKSDADGVVLDVTPNDAAEAHRRLVGRAVANGLYDARVLITGMVTAAVEAVVGAFRDPQFGPVVMFGLGGIWVEALADVAFRLAPFDAGEAHAMIGEIRGYRLFGALRRRPARDLDAAADALVRVSELMIDRDDIAEIDINPLFPLERGAAVGDARIVLA